MFKLLTEEERKKVRHEYVRRRSIVILLALKLVFAIGIIGLLPSYVLSEVRHKEARDRMRIIENSGLIEDTSNAETWFKDINRKLQILAPALDKDRPSDLIDKVLDQATAGISITNISWAKVKGKPTMSISGVSPDRQKLITFRDKLNDSGYFSDVTLPVSNLAQDSDINFQIKLTPVQEKTAKPTS